jgi:hypothetical protein
VDAVGRLLVVDVVHRVAGVPASHEEGLGSPGGGGRVEGGGGGVSGRSWGCSTGGGRKGCLLKTSVPTNLGVGGAPGCLDFPRIPQPPPQTGPNQSGELDLSHPPSHQAASAKRPGRELKQRGGILTGWGTHQLEVRGRGRHVGWLEWTNIIGVFFLSWLGHLDRDVRVPRRSALSVDFGDGGGWIGGWRGGKGGGGGGCDR